jgi:HEAT repeat protein
VLRRQALRALVQIKGASTASRTSELLVTALGDADQEVRATAAEGLAARSDRAGLGRMMSLLRDNEAGVAEPLGSLVTPALVPELAELLGSVNEDILANTLGAAVKRKDLAEQLRVDLVRTLAKISSPMSTAALADYVGSSAGKGDKADKAKKEAQAVLEQRSNSR